MTKDQDRSAASDASSTDNPRWPSSVETVLRDAREKGLSLTIVETTASARSAEEAAAAVGASVAQIVKSLVFRGARTGKPYLLLVSGANRVDEKAMETHLGEPLERPNADFVRQITGFAIGGVSPFGAPEPLATYMDEALLAESQVWAAAGSPRHVFSIVPLQLRSATSAAVGPVA